MLVSVNKDSEKAIKAKAKKKDISVSEAADSLIKTAAGRNAAVARYVPKGKKKGKAEKAKKKGKVKLARKAKVPAKRKKPKTKVPSLNPKAPRAKLKKKVKADSAPSPTPELDLSEAG